MDLTKWISFDPSLRFRHWRRTLPGRHGFHTDLHCPSLPHQTEKRGVYAPHPPVKGVEKNNRNVCSGKHTGSDQKMPLQREFRGKSWCESTLLRPSAAFPRFTTHVMEPLPETVRSAFRSLIPNGWLPARRKDRATGQAQWSLVYCTITMLFERAYYWLSFTAIDPQSGVGSN